MMISIKKLTSLFAMYRQFYLIISFCFILFDLSQVEAKIQQQLYQAADQNQVDQLLAVAAQQQQQHQQLSSNFNNDHNHNIPGHYEFEVAPKMEPPIVRKPPYQQSAQMCPGSDLFAGFSPKDTLCGDLNQGKVPLNPLGQSITDQSYPFELIKNKTLQFLARALPILKSEYETIPKVARFVPAQHLLNPTHYQSPLANEHFDHINQRTNSDRMVSPQTTSFSSIQGDGNLNAPSNNLNGFHYTIGAVEEDAPLIEAGSQLAHATILRPYLLPPASVVGGLSGPAAPSTSAISDNNNNNNNGASLVNNQRRRRRKRSPRQAVSQQPTTLNENNIQHIMIAEMSPNATLVVSSAHSGRIGPDRLNERDASQLAVITKDGYKPIHSSSNPTKQLKGQPHQQQQQQSEQTIKNQKLVSSSSSSSSSSSPTSSSQKSNNNNNVNNNENRQQQQQHFPGTTNLATTNNNKNNNHATITKEEQHRQNHGDQPLATSVSAGNSNSPNSPDNNAFVGQARSNGDSPLSNSHGLQSSMNSHPMGSTGSSSSQNSNNNNNSPPLTNDAGQQQQQQQQQQHQKPDTLAKRSRLPCSEAGNGFTSTICQAASALIEGEKVPAWLQLAKHIGNAYSASSDNLASNSNPVWSILSSLAQESSPKSSSSLAQTKSNFFNILGPLTSYLIGGGGNGGPAAISKSSDQATTASKESSDLQQQNNNDKKQQHSSLSSLSSSTLTRLALAGWASNAIASLVEYFVPSVFQSASRTFARRKKPFDPQETFIDTPASLAALSSSSSSSSSMKQQQSAPLIGNGKQPPTPCPSVEEYISPTFARNYQGAWKYVVQIPGEGYFTQTIQRTSCVKQKCEFTDGVCHESPRWVSLLVAEIYYPNTVYSGPAPSSSAPSAASNGLMEQQQPQHLLASSSNNNIQQLALAQQQQQQLHFHQHPQQHSASSNDPLQMTDSLTTYNHNLNNAFINAANQLGWDPNNVENMQQLANAYNYQFLQRNGIVNSQQPQVAESRVSHSYAAPAPTLSNSPQLPIVMKSQQQQEQQQAAYNDYIAALATEALRQNPGMSINDLINSLQYQKRRKRRDLSAGSAPLNNQQQTRRSGFNNNNNNQPQVSIQQQQSTQMRHSSNVNNNNNIMADSMSVNDIAVAQQQYKQQNEQLNNPSIQQSNQQQPVSSINNNSPPQAPSVAGADSIQATNSNNGIDNNGNQMDCDGHDKIGCYVVRVYYDWFLVPGSCKCWKTTTGTNNNGSSSSSGNSFLRRIFTG